MPLTGGVTVLDIFEGGSLGQGLRCAQHCVRLGPPQAVMEAGVPAGSWAVPQYHRGLRSSTLYPWGQGRTLRCRSLSLPVWSRGPGCSLATCALRVKGFRTLGGCCLRTVETSRAEPAINPGAQSLV